MLYFLQLGFCFASLVSVSVMCVLLLWWGLDFSYLLRAGFG